MNTDVQVTFLITFKEHRIHLRHAGLSLAGLCSGANCMVAGARRDGRLLALAVVQQDDDLEDALESCLDALEYEGAEAAVAYSPLHGPGAPVGTAEREVLFRIGRCLAAFRAIHLVDWLLCGDKTYHCLEPAPADPSDWWDIPEHPTQRPQVQLA